MAATPKPVRKINKMVDKQIRHTAKDLAEGRSIQEPSKHYIAHQKMQKKSLKKIK